MLHEGEVDIPPYLHEVNEQNLKRNWHQSKVYQLKHRPNFPVCYQSWHQLRFQLILCALNIFSLQIANIYIKACNWKEGKNGLGEQQFFAQASQIIAWTEFGNDVWIGKVERWTISKQSITHKVYGALPIKGVLSRHFYGTKKWSNDCLIKLDIQNVED